VTGKLSTGIYRDDCWFLSPDPDLPIHGLRKYVGVASHLFDSKSSSSELLSLEQKNQIQDDTNLLIMATWRMSLTLKLPWRPRLPTFSGTTLYHFDENHLVFRHEETWDISLTEAFLAMFELKTSDFDNLDKRLSTRLLIDHLGDPQDSCDDEDITT